MTTKHNPKGWVKGDVLYTDEDVASLPKGTEWETLTQNPWSAIVVYVPPAPAADPAPTTHAVQLVEPVESYGQGREAYPLQIMTDRGFVRFHDRVYRPDDALEYAASIVSAALAVKAASK